MSTPTETPSFLHAHVDPVDPREQAKAALAAAESNLTSTKNSIAAATAAKIAAQKIIDAAKPSIMLAEAQVTIAKAHLLQFGALPKEEGDKVSFDDVMKVLRGAESQMTGEDIAAKLAEGGVHTNIKNLKTYLSRWTAAGAILKGEKNNPLEPARFYAPPVPMGVPAAAPPAAAPSFIPTPSAPPADPDVLGEDFPGVEALAEAGVTTKAALVGKTAADLVLIPGIGSKTADKILAALAG